MRSESANVMDHVQRSRCRVGGQPWLRWPQNSRSRAPRSPTPTTGPTNSRPIFASACWRPPSEMGYAGPDPVARSLRTRRAGAVGLILTEPLNYSFSDPAALDFVAGLAESCEAAGQGLLLVAAGPNRSVERRNRRGAVGRCRRVRRVLGVRRRPLPARGRAACAADRGRRPAQGRARHLAGVHRRPRGDAERRRVRHRARAPRPRRADDETGTRLATRPRPSPRSPTSNACRPPTSTCSASASTASTTP